MNLKKLMEQRASLKAELDDILEAVKNEQRAMTDEENTKFEGIEKQIKDLDRTIEAEKRARNLQIEESGEPAPAEKRSAEEQEAAEIRAFDAYLRDIVEYRDGDVTPTDVNMTKGSNGAVIPASIANKIITKVVDISPLYGMRLATTWAARSRSRSTSKDPAPRSPSHMRPSSRICSALPALSSPSRCRASSAVR